MKKLSKILIFLAIISLPAVSFAEITLTASDITATSATLKASGLFSNTAYQIYVQGVDDNYNKTQDVMSNSEGFAQSVFSGLQSSSEKGFKYNASLLLKSNSSLLRTTTFSTTSKPSAPPSAPTISFSASPASITYGKSSTLTWSSTNASSCAASEGWTGTLATSGTKTVSPSATSTYKLSCTGAGGTTIRSATVTVSAASAATTWWFKDSDGDVSGPYASKEACDLQRNGDETSGCISSPDNNAPSFSTSSSAAKDWYYQWSGADKTVITTGPNTEADCKADQATQAAITGNTIVKSCYESTAPGGDNNWYVQYKGTGSEAGITKTDGPYDQSTCEFHAETLKVNNATIVKSCFKSSTKPASSSNTGDLSYKGGGLVPDCPDSGCGWPELMKLIARVIDFLIFYLSLPIAAIAFAYSGWLFMTSGDDPGKRSQAIEIFKKVGLGLVIAMAAWLIVSTILSALETKEGYSLLKDIQ